MWGLLFDVNKTETDLASSRRFYQISKWIKSNNGVTTNTRTRTVDVLRLWRHDTSENKRFPWLLLPRIIESLVADVGWREDGRKKELNTHVWPHSVVTGLSKISRQTGQTNSDTSLLPSETFFLCCAALNPPSIAISFLHWVSPPTSRSWNDVTGLGFFFYARGRSYSRSEGFQVSVQKKQQKVIVTIQPTLQVDKQLPAISNYFLDFMFSL